MNDKLDPLFGVHTQALQVWQRRAEVLASNLANADTPHYLARDVNFRAALATANTNSMPLARSEPGHLVAAGSNEPGGALLYRVPLQPSLDGNTVDTQTEQSTFAENAVHYQASLTFINAQIHLLRMAITGGA